MKRCVCGLLLIASGSAGAEPLPPPMRQLDFPVLAIGDIGHFRVQVPAYAGGQGRVSYAAHALMPGSDEDRGYRFIAVACSDGGFTPVVHYEERGVACSRVGQSPHPAFEMVITVGNTGAAEGEVVMPDGLRSLVYDVGQSRAPWRIYGVRP
ncbi:hypothetical protein [Stenotrophomonas indicatrix]|uniref:hypothetical protein n=1 Tax=Stenotrophomonas indicatrix TaxID=2045451 RepID=UPI0008B4C23A|nr:hypothetical protein [Stenotrophomonas indicatrix]SET79790.1 hypothetical protein SAMN05720615_1081 [Stenotrophomonas indicatrix]